MIFMTVKESNSTLRVNYFKNWGKVREAGSKEKRETEKGLKWQRFLE